MNVFRGAARTYRRQKDLLKAQGIGRLTAETPLYENTSTLSSRFTFPLMIMQIFVT